MIGLEGAEGADVAVASVEEVQAVIGHGSPLRPRSRSSAGPMRERWRGPGSSRPSATGFRQPGFFLWINPLNIKSLAVPTSSN